MSNIEKMKDGVSLYQNNAVKCITNDQAVKHTLHTPHAKFIVKIKTLFANIDDTSSPYTTKRRCWPTRQN